MKLMYHICFVPTESSVCMHLLEESLNNRSRDDDGDADDGDDDEDDNGDEEDDDDMMIEMMMIEIMIKLPSSPRYIHSI